MNVTMPSTNENAGDTKSYKIEQSGVEQVKLDLLLKELTKELAKKEAAVTRAIGIKYVHTQ